MALTHIGIYMIMSAGVIGQIQSIRSNLWREGVISFALVGFSIYLLGR
jgi:hypothetical protein